jgi:hypothetical protein
MIWTVLLEQALRRVYGPSTSTGPSDATACDPRPLVLVADGVGGAELCSLGLEYAAAWSQAALEVRRLGWGHGFGRWYRDLTETDWHAQQADRLAAEALAAHQAGRTVYLVGKSGGTGLVVWALERLPAGSVEAAVLLAPALSPGYDLSRALAAIRGEMTVFHSPLDLIVLGAGTSLFGTVDRVHTAAAGLHGFRRPATPADGSFDPYSRLRQIRWTPRMGRTGYLGGHVGPDLPGFLRRYVLPRLGASKPPCP